VWKSSLQSAFLETSTLSFETNVKGVDAMGFEFELSEVIESLEFDMGDSSTKRSLIMRYVSAGILFPDEVRQAEQILRHLSSKT
jgi:hypothetical protein